MKLLVKASLICVSESLFPYILLKRRLIPLSPLLICPIHSHFLLCLKRIIWWQEYAKPTGVLGALGADMSTSLQVHRSLPSSSPGSGDSSSLTPLFPFLLGAGEPDYIPFL